jgi:hypothetical protein
MTDDRPKGGWWQTVPGVLTATATVITAIAGLIVALYQSGFFQQHKPNPAPETAPAASVETTSAESARSPPAESPGATPAESHAASTQSPLNSPSQPAPKPVNLLSAENGGQLIITSGDDWFGTIDGKEGFNQIGHGLADQSEAVFAFKDERSATIERFTMLIGRTQGNNVKQFELFVSDDSPTGPFVSLGKFQTQNFKVLKTPYQEFTFPPVKAKYLKIKLLSTHDSFPHPDLWEIQLFGHLDPP